MAWTNAIASELRFDLANAHQHPGIKVHEAACECEVAERSMHVITHDTYSKKERTKERKKRKKVRKEERKKKERKKERERERD